MTREPTAPQLRLELPAWLAAARPAAAAAATDAERMRLVLDLCRESVRHGGGPFAAMILDPAGRVAGVGVNLVVSGRSSILHAEIVAIIEAEAAAGRHTLPDGYSLVTSCEPCAMCLGAVLWSGLSRVVWAATREDAMAAGFDEGPVFTASHEYLRARGVHLEPGPLRTHARAVLDDYRARGGVLYNRPGVEGKKEK